MVYTNGHQHPNVKTNEEKQKQNENKQTKKENNETKV
jgi:hypothetical protein